VRINLSLQLVQGLDSLRERLSALLSTLSNGLAAVIESAPISGTSTSTYTEVTHTLGRVPDYVHVEPQAQCRWWITESDRAQWTSTRVFLHFDTASVNFTGYVSVLDS